MRNIDKIMFEFFNRYSPCPPEIPNCDELRKDYFKETKNVSCKKCNISEINSKYMEKICSILNS